MRHVWLPLTQVNTFTSGQRINLLFKNRYCQMLQLDLYMMVCLFTFSDWLVTVSELRSALDAILKSLLFKGHIHQIILALILIQMKLFIILYKPFLMNQNPPLHGLETGWYYFTALPVFLQNCVIFLGIRSVCLTLKRNIQ